MVSPKKWLSILSVNSLRLFNVSFPILKRPNIVNGEEVIAQTDKSAEAERLLRQGTELFKQGTGESKRQAIEIWKKAAQLYRKVGDQLAEATVILGIGSAYSDLGEKQNALEFYNQSLPLSQQIGDKIGEFIALRDIGGVYSDLGEQQKALEFSNQSLLLSQQLGDQTGEASVLNSIGRIYSDLGEKQKALEFYNQSLLLSQQVGNKTGDASTLNNIGRVYSDLGEKQKALNYYEQALPLSQQEGDRSGEATILDNIGRVYSDLGEKQKALNYYQEALFLRREVGDRGGEATTLNNIGSVYSDLGEKQKALDFYNQSLSLKREVGDRGGEASILNNIGLVYSDLGEQQKALYFYNQSLTLSREVEDKLGISSRLNNIARVYSNLGEQQKALDFYNQSLTLSKQVGNKAGEATAISNIGLVYSNLGEKQKALDFYNQSLSLKRQVGDKAGVASTLSNIGLAYSDLGEKQEALDFYNQSLTLWQQVGDKAGESYTLNNIGLVYSDLGEQEKAAKFYLQSLTLKRQVGDKAGVAFSLNNISAILLSIGEKQEALESLKQSLTILEEVEDKEGQGNLLNNIGYVYSDLGEQQKALNYYQRALTLRQQVGNRSGEAITLSNIGGVYSSLGEKREALNYYEQALPLSQQVGDQGGSATTLYNIAQVKRDQGKLTESLTFMEKSIKIIEDLRTKIVVQDLRTSYFATIQGYYQCYIDLLMELHKQNPNQGYDRKALNASERSRARSLLDILAESGADIKTGVDPELLAQEKRLLQKLNTLDQARQRNNPPPGYNLDKLKEEIETLSNEVQQLEVKIKQNSPRYANLKYPDPLTASEIQQQVIDKDTIFLQYSLGAERSYLWLVTPTEISSYELPKKAEIEELAKRFIQEIDSESLVPETGNKLSEILLLPVANKLENKRLLIVGDGILQATPFAALPLTSPPTPLLRGEGGTAEEGNSSSTLAGGNEGGLNYQPLIVNHEIVTLPSASSIVILRKQVKDRTPAPKKVAVFADPVFEDNDIRLKTDSQTKNETETENNDVTRMALKRSVNDFNSDGESMFGNGNFGLSFKRLKETEQEAEAILALVNDNLKQGSLGFDANRETAINPNLSQYQIVHLATHGLLNESQPELSGLVLSLYDKTGKEKPGFLQLNDIFNLEIPAELVVLSACKTGIGEEIRGEGLVSLTRGFMYAGAKRVVVSLWSVGDNSTSKLMKNYYRKMLETGKNPVESMRESQLEMLSSENWKAPYYWAPFVVQGEWK